MNKEFKSFLGLPGAGEIHRCYYPLKCDTYGRGCSNNCSYCYSKSVLFFRNLWDNENPATIDPNKLDKILYDSLVNDKKGDIPSYIRHRQPLRLGAMTDCFSDAEIENETTYKVLQILKKYKYPVLILTKNKLVATDKYLKVLDPDLGYIQLTITTPYDDIAALYEEKASSTTERLEALKILGDAGFATAVRINPMFPMYKDGHFSRGVKSEKFKYFDWTLIDLIKKYKGQTVIAGFVRLSSWNIRWIKEKTGEDLSWLFDQDEKQKNSALHFTLEEKRYYYEKAKKQCDKLGLDFSVCYDGDDSYDEFRYLWKNQDDCCNGKGRIKGFTVAWDFERMKLGKMK